MTLSMCIGDNNRFPSSTTIPHCCGSFSGYCLTMVAEKAAIQSREEKEEEKQVAGIVAVMS